MNWTCKRAGLTKKRAECTRALVRNRNALTLFFSKKIAVEKKVLLKRLRPYSSLDFTDSVTKKLTSFTTSRFRIAKEYR